ncbi:DUF1499 domain-containing protein [Chenggangzhangella methanolivorans]|uniref:DUF1499 domain-containing protein n=1 Tax=Chenggangzhangella methanolivorans TaxID=1437009 RepID=A0A9E6UMQ7_9HYPH|nr:DUF1499 domain-containing protein [Chenggangzhangella methanolivorans]QZO00256.1 DUF1499 domain-containing protein [Chenggangzhangella methanolivorans]
MTYVLRPEPPKRSFFAGAALSLAFFALLVTLYAAALIRFRAIEASAAFPAFLAGLLLAALAVPLSLVAMTVVWRTGRTGGVRALFALLIAAATLAGPAYVAGAGVAAPALTDVSTDLVDPPRFDRAPRDRARVDLPAPVAISPAQAETQRAAYPDLASLRLPLPPEEASNLAIGVVEERGWRLLGPTSYPRGGPPTGRIEAVARTPLLGVSDDVSIRIRADGDGSRVDMRSASRFGTRDFGTNAARIKAFLADLAAAANVAP